MITFAHSNKSNYFCDMRIKNNKYNTIKIALIAIPLFITSCVSNSDKSKETTQPKQEVVGGYSATKEISADDRAMFDKAIESIENYTDIKPLSVTTQVVAGTNYKFTCSAKDKEGKVIKGEIVIFKPLPHTDEEPSITKIQF